MSKSTPLAPVAAKRAYVHTEHGVRRPDPYYWLRERDNPEVLAYINAENAYTDAITAHQRPLEQLLFEQMKGRLQEDDRTAPVHDGSWLYYSRTEAGKSYPIHCRIDALHQGAQEQVLLDVNALAEGHEFFEVGESEVSPDHRYLAYTTDTRGDEVFSLQIKDLQTGSLLPEVIEEVGDSIAWAADSKTLFYSTVDEALRPWQIHRHHLGQPPEHDALVFQEDDERFFAYVERTHSDALMVIFLESIVTTESWLIDAHHPDEAPRVVQPRIQGVEYRVDHHGDRLLIVTNEALDAEGVQTQANFNFKLMEAPLGAKGLSEWTELIPHRPEVHLQSLEVFSGHIVMQTRAGGHTQLIVWDLSTGEQHPIHMPDPSYSLWLEDNPTFDTHKLRFGYSSLVTPESVFEYDMSSREMQLIKEQPVLGGFDPGLYEARYVFATASDGTQVPISMVFKRGLLPDGSHPTLLYGYGSYGIDYDPSFSSSKLTLLDRGVIFAIAHIRGGGELGRPWYEGGKLQNKPNTFTDFVAAAQALIDQGWTTPARLAIRGGSAGGLLIGATVNLRPDLFMVAIAEVPFVDVVTTMLDASIPLTATEWDEWGDPRQRAAFDVMLSYSPYDNVRAVKYPDMLIVSGLNDPRVQYWEPTKWAARLRDLATPDTRILLKTNMAAGHGGASGRYDALKEEAFVQAFLLEHLGVDPR